MATLLQDIYKVTTQSDTFAQSNEPTVIVTSADGTQTTLSDNTITRSEVIQEGSTHAMGVWYIAMSIVFICIMYRLFKSIQECFCKSDEDYIREYFHDLETDDQVKSNYQQAEMMNR
mgnify:CR=1 FL=1